MTQQSKHTPGPWIVSTFGKSAEVMADRPGQHAAYGIAHVPLDMNYKLQAKANAHLIAAAPELLAVAEMIDAWGNGLRHPTEHERKTVAAARAALSKARGEG